MGREKNNPTGKTGPKYSTKIGLDAYELARDGHTDAAIARMIGVSYATYSRWLKTRPDMVLFLTRARAYKPRQAKVQEFIFSKLSKEVRQTWERIKQGTTLSDNPEERAEQLLAGHQTLEKQHLYIAALVHHKFNHAAAAREAGVDPRKVREDWMQDSYFAALIEELQVAELDFFQDAFYGAVERGDSSVIVHAAKTKLRSRGFGDVKTVEMSGKVEHQHTKFDLQPILDRVSVAARREFLTAIDAIEKEREGVSSPLPLPSPVPPSGIVLDAAVIE